MLIVSDPMDWRQTLDEKLYQKVVKENLRARHKGRKQVICRTKQLYPKSAEREYQRLSVAYMNILQTILKQDLPKLLKAAEKEQKAREVLHQDGIFDLIRAAIDVFTKMQDKLVSQIEKFPMKERLGKVAYQAQKLSIKEWKRAVRSTLGINILEDYYSGEFYEELLQKWVDKNVGLIKTIPQNTLRKMQDIVLEGFRDGKTAKSISAEIQKTYGIDKSHAMFIARDQISKLNSDLTRKQQEDAGVTEYIWRTSEDSRVRDSHRELNGTRHRWDDPPVVDERTGRRCHPGEDYQCRCVPKPVFDVEKLTVPLAGNEER